MYMLMRDAEGRKKQARSNKQHGKQHSTSTFQKKDDLPRMGLKPTPLHSLDRALYQLCYSGLAGPKSYISIHLMNRLNTCIST